jgi:hypothetical protein
MLVTNRSLIKNISGLVLVKAMSMFVSLSIVPYLLLYFNNDHVVLGGWLSLFTFLMLAMSLDFGIGNRLKNDLIMCYVHNHDEYKLLAIAFISSLFLAVLFLLLSLFVFLISHLFSLDTSSVFSTDSTGTTDVSVIIYFILLIIFILPVRVVIPLLQAKQKNAVGGFLLVLPQMLIYFFLICFLVLFDIDDRGKILYLLMVLFYGSFVSYLIVLINQLDYYKFSLTVLSQFKLFSFSKQLLSFKSGMSFFIIQLSIIFICNSNEIFYIVFGSAEDVVNYQFYYRPFSLFFVGFSIISLPFWSAIRQSQLSGDYLRSKKLFYFLLLLNIPVWIVLIPSYIYFQSFIDLWLGFEKFIVNDTDVFLFVIFAATLCLMSTFSAVLSGFDLIVFQARVLFFSCVVKILGIYLINSLFLNVDSVLIMTIFSLILVVALFLVKTISVVRKIYFFL